MEVDDYGSVEMPEAETEGTKLNYSKNSNEKPGSLYQYKNNQNIS